MFMLEKFEDTKDTEASSSVPGDSDLFLVDRLSFMPAVCSVKSAELLLEGIVDGAVITALLGNSSELLEDIVGGAGSDPSELFLAFCLMDCLIDLFISIISSTTFFQSLLHYLN